MSRSVSAPSSVTNTSPCWNGLIVPGSTLRYGSSLIRVTLRPRDSRMAASDADAMPLPKEDTTPPVTNTYLVMSFGLRAPQQRNFGLVVKRDYIDRPFAPFSTARPGDDNEVSHPRAALSARRDTPGKHASPSWRRIVSQRSHLRHPGTAI